MHGSNTENWTLGTNGSAAVAQLRCYVDCRTLVVFRPWFTLVPDQNSHSILNFNYPLSTLTFQRPMASILRAYKYVNLFFSLYSTTFIWNNRQYSSPSSPLSGFLYHCRCPLWCRWRDCTASYRGTRKATRRAWSWHHLCHCSSYLIDCYVVREDSTALILWRYVLLVICQVVVTILGRYHVWTVCNNVVPILEQDGFR